MIRQGTNILKENQKNRLDFKPDLKQINFLDRRVYKRDEGVYYPSVTTILQYMPKNKFFDNWLKALFILRFGIPFLTWRFTFSR